MGWVAFDGTNDALSAFGLSNSATSFATEVQVRNLTAPSFHHIADSTGLEFLVYFDGFIVSIPDLSGAYADTAYSWSSATTYTFRCEMDTTAALPGGMTWRFLINGSVVASGNQSASASGAIRLSDLSLFQYRTNINRLSCEVMYAKVWRNGTLVFNQDNQSASSWNALPQIVGSVTDVGGGPTYEDRTGTSNGTSSATGQATYTYTVNGTSNGTSSATGVVESTAGVRFVGGQLGSTTGINASYTGTFNLTGGESGYASSTPQAGDFVVIAVADASSANRLPAVTGYTQIGTTQYQNDTADSALYVGQKFMGGTPDTQFTITTGGTTAATHSREFHVRVYRGVDPTTPLDVTSVLSGAINSGIPNPAAITPTSANSRVVAFGAGAFNTTAITAGFTGPANLNNFQSAGSGGATYSAVIGGGDAPWTSGAFDPGAYTHTRGVMSQDSATWATLALRAYVPPTTVYEDRTGTSNGTSSATGQATYTYTVSGTSSGTSSATGQASDVRGYWLLKWHFHCFGTGFGQSYCSWNI